MMKSIRVALRGSGFDLGAPQAIADAGFEVVELAGTSGCSIIAGLYAGGNAAGSASRTVHDARLVAFD